MSSSARSMQRCEILRWVGFHAVIAPSAPVFLSSLPHLEGAGAGARAAGSGTFGAQEGGSRRDVKRKGQRGSAVGILGRRLRLGVLLRTWGYLQRALQREPRYESQVLVQMRHGVMHQHRRFTLSSDINHRDPGVECLPILKWAFHVPRPLEHDELV